MHVLKKSIAIITVPLLIYSCKPRGALTPEDAFMMLREAYSRNDSTAIENLLSRRSREKVETIITVISQMDDVRLRTLAMRFGVTVDRLRDMTVRDFLSLELMLGKKIGEDTLADLTRYEIIGKDVKGNRAVLRTENGMEIIFVKEGPYWKLDLEDY